MENGKGVDSGETAIPAWSGVFALSQGKKEVKIPKEWQINHKQYYQKYPF